MIGYVEGAGLTGYAGLVEADRLRSSSFKGSGIMNWINLALVLLRNLHDSSRAAGESWVASRSRCHRALRPCTISTSGSREGWRLTDHHVAIDVDLHHMAARAMLGGRLGLQPEGCISGNGLVDSVDQHLEQAQVMADAALVGVHIELASPASG